MAAQADSLSNTKLSSRRRLKRSAPSLADQKIAAIQFSAMDLNIAECMSNDELGAKMPWVRVAIAILMKSKPDLVEMVASMDGGDLLKEGGVSKEMCDLLSNGRDQFKGLSDICGEALRRFLIAAHEVAVRTA